MIIKELLILNITYPNIKYVHFLAFIDQLHILTLMYNQNALLIRGEIMKHFTLIRTWCLIHLPGYEQALRDAGISYHGGQSLRIK